MDLRGVAPLRHVPRDPSLICAQPAGPAHPPRPARATRQASLPTRPRWGHLLAAEFTPISLILTTRGRLGQVRTGVHKSQPRTGHTRTNHETNTRTQTRSVTRSLAVVCCCFVCGFVCASARGRPASRTCGAVESWRLHPGSNCRRLQNFISV